MAALFLGTVALAGNLWVASLVWEGFQEPTPANGVFGQPNVQVPVSGAFPTVVPNVGALIGFSPSIRPMTIDLELVSLDRGTQIASFVANITTPPSLLTLIPGRDGRPAVTERVLDQYSVTPAGQGLALPLRVGATYGDGLAYATSLSLTAIVQDVNAHNSALTISFNLPLQGTPGDFPGDWYQLANDFVVWPPTVWALSIRSGAMQIGQPSIPVRLTLAAGPAMRGFVIKMVSRRNVDGSFLRLVITTDARTMQLAYIMGSVPILLACVALVLLLSDRERRRSPGRTQELALTIVLGVLAVVPIRAVVVPADLQSPTRVDLLLALGVTLSVGILLLGIAIQLTTRTAKPKQET